MGCHLEQDPPYSTPAETFESDVHGQAGFTCEVCHGGDPEAWDYDEAKDPARGFIGIPVGRQVVEVCGRCHADPDLIRRYNPNLPTDQIAKYWTSGHGKSLKQGDAGLRTYIESHPGSGAAQKGFPDAQDRLGSSHHFYQLPGSYPLPVYSHPR